MTPAARFALARRLAGYAAAWAANARHFPAGTGVRQAMETRARDCRAAAEELAPGLVGVHVPLPVGIPVEGAADLGPDDAAAGREMPLPVPPVPDAVPVPSGTLQAAVEAAEVVLARRPHDDHAAGPLAAEVEAIREVLADRAGAGPQAGAGE